MLFSFAVFHLIFCRGFWKERSMQIEYSLIEHGAPTLAGLKTANLFPVKAEGEDVIRSLRRVNRILNRKGIRAIPLKKKSDSILLYLFRPERLEEDLNQPETVCMLKEMGYPCGRMDLCISCLVRHLKEDDSFPHEIGLFLGYPPSDVKSFMNSQRDGVKCTGCWKAYSNQEEAERTFEKYRKCTRAYRREMRNGRTLESLAVETAGRKRLRAVDR